MWHILIKKGFFGLKLIFKVSLSVWSTLWHINASQHIRTCRSVSPSCHVSLLLTLHLTALNIWLIVLRSRIFLSALFLKWRNFCITRSERGGSDGKSFAQTAQNKSSQQYAEPSSHATILPLSHPILLSFAPYSQSQSHRQRVSCVKRP